MWQYFQIDVEEESNNGSDIVQLIYTCETGRFSKTLQWGMNYIMIMKKVNSDAILAETMRNQSAGNQQRPTAGSNLSSCRMKKTILQTKFYLT